MKVRYPRIHQGILDLPVGESLVYNALNGRSLKQIMGDVTYYFTGHVEANDQRLGRSDCEHVSPVWDWRVTMSWEKDEDNPGFWILTLTKIPVPDDQKYNGQDGRVIARKQALETELDQLMEKADVIEAKFSSRLKG